MAGSSDRQGRFSIPTEYKGITFRSKLEADWARFLDKTGIRWSYEPKGKYVRHIYRPGEEFFVLCDFWLPEARQLLEIKGAWNAAERTKFAMFAAAVEVELFVGGPDGRLGFVAPNNPGPDHPGDLPVVVFAATLAYCHHCHTRYFADYHLGYYEQVDCRKCRTPRSLMRYHVGRANRTFIEWPGAQLREEDDPEKWVTDWFYADFGDEEWL